VTRDRGVEVPGVRSDAAEVRDPTAHEAWAPARHTRAAHRAWGVAVGLAVWVVDVGRVLVEPGVALTRDGDPVVLGADGVLVVPGGHRVLAVRGEGWG
jgi:hypothetical protein